MCICHNLTRETRAGLKTEPAFARYFHIEGDPYQALLEMASCDDDELMAFVQRQRFSPKYPNP